MPEYFSDFLCESSVNPDSFMKIFEDKILGKRINFDNPFPDPLVSNQQFQDSEQTKTPSKVLA